MKLTFYRTKVPNFGDELNTMMWDQLLPSGFFDEDAAELFLGIGSIIFDTYPPSSRKIVAGSGDAGYTSSPNVHDGSWNILWVRGPATAERLKLDPTLAITDSAVLLRTVSLPSPAGDVDIAFMPHVDSLDRSRWVEVCRLANMTFLDPSAPVDETLAKIRGARLVITEAMHGAIVADALRTPWIGIRPFNRTHRAKWNDWAASINLTLRPKRLSPSSMAEVWTLVSGKQATVGRSRRYLADGPSEPVNRLLRQVTAYELRYIAESVEPQLSTDRAIDRVTDRALSRLRAFITTRATT